MNYGWKLSDGGLRLESVQDLIFRLGIQTRVSVPGKGQDLETLKVPGLKKSKSPETFFEGLGTSRD